jgi:hypothetical protein
MSYDSGRQKGKKTAEDVDNEQVNTGSPEGQPGREHIRHDEAGGFQHPLDGPIILPVR